MTVTDSQLAELEHLHETLTASNSDEALMDFQHKVDAALPSLLKIARAVAQNEDGYDSEGNCILLCKEKATYDYGNHADGCAWVIARQIAGNR